MRAIYTAALGMQSQQQRLDNLANNIANAKTPGYKATRTDFKDALYTQTESPVSDSGAAGLLTGSGVLVAATATDFRSGPITETGNTLDFALTGAGFFTVESAGGQRYYTRNGSFLRSGPVADAATEEETAYLVTAQGYYVLDKEGNRIALPAAGAFSVNADGAFTTAEGAAAALGIVSFANPDGLAPAGGACYQETAVSGEPANPEAPGVLQGSLEEANVEMSEELTLLIRSQRAYSLAGKALRVADEMDGLANNMRK